MYIIHFTYPYGKIIIIVSMDVNQSGKKSDFNLIISVVSMTKGDVSHE